MQRIIPLASVSKPAHSFHVYVFIADGTIIDRQYEEQRYYTAGLINSVLDRTKQQSKYYVAKSYEMFFMFPCIRVSYRSIFK
jgi:hypothetical protein